VCIACLQIITRMLPVGLFFDVQQISNAATQNSAKLRVAMSKILWEGHALNDPTFPRAYVASILNPLHYKFLATPLMAASVSTRQENSRTFKLLRSKANEVILPCKLIIIPYLLSGLPSRQCCIKGALAFVCFSFFFSGYVC